MAAEHGFGFEIDEELCEGDLVAVTVTAPNGLKIQVYAEVVLSGRTAILRDLAVYGVNVTSREFGASAIRQMLREAMEIFDVDRIRIEGAWRLSGANPRRTVLPLEFRRNSRDTRADPG